jgi:hypothetical protein
MEMKPLKSIVLLAAASLLVALPLMAQTTSKPAPGRASPHDTVSTVVDGSRVMLVYGRPHVKDPKTGEARKIWGGLVPYGKVWRTGADEATLLVTQQPLSFGETTIPAGAYTVFTLPVEKGTSKLIINKQIGQWGTQYDEKQDLARVDLKTEATDASVEQFTMAVQKNSSGGGGTIRMMWENTQFSVPFTVKK